MKKLHNEFCALMGVFGANVLIEKFDGFENYMSFRKNHSLDETIKFLAA